MFAFLALALLATPPSSARIDLDVKDADIHNVLRLLADVGKVNMVVPDDVGGKVTLKLKNVPWREAFLVTLGAQGLGSEQDGSVIQVDTLERISKRTAERAERAALQQKASPLLTVLIPLSYARAADVAPLVKALLSPRGSLQIDARTNTLIVTDAAVDVDRVRRDLRI